MTTSELHRALAQQFTLILNDMPATAPVLSLVRHEVVDLPKKNASTDGLRLQFDPTFARTLLEACPDGATVRGVYLHEAWHLFLGHLWRRGSRDRDLWNQACDHEVNLSLNALFANWKDHHPGVPCPALPEGVLADATYTSLPAEEIYARLLGKKSQPQPEPQPQQPQPPQPQSRQPPQQPNGKPQPGPGQPQPQPGQPGQSQAQPGQGHPGQPGQPGGGQPEPGQEPGQGGIGDMADIPQGQEQAVQEAVTRAIITSRTMGTLPGDLESHVQKLLNPRIPWTEVLRHLLQPTRGDTKLTWCPRHAGFAQAGFTLPSARGERMGTLIFAGDTSGSIGSEELDGMAAEACAVLEDLAPEQFIVAWADAAVHVWEPVQPGERIPSPKGGGGTDFRPVFERVEAEGLRPAVLVFLTDLYGTFPEQAPEYPVIWCHYGGGSVRPPWGDCVAVNPDPQ